MNSARWREVRAIFDELVDASASTQAARLATLDPELRRDVELLLDADVDSEARLTRLFAPAEPVRDPLGLSGRMLSHFRVLELLGVGGMGVVYVAEDTRLDRKVALKVPLPEHALDASARRRFLHEARSAGALDHPNLCAIHEVGESDDGHLFLAMPLYRGETLRTRLEREATLPPERAIDVARQIARGLSAAHEAGIVHRDLKPGNVMILPDGSVKILDFGLAKARAQGMSVSRSLAGTAAYMAPEQVRGQPVDGRTDLWALGVVLYEMVTGRKPFEGEHDASLAHAIVHCDPVPPSAVRDDLPAGLEALVLALLSKEPAARPATAGDLERRLAAIAGGRALPTAQLRRRRPRLAVGAVLLAVVAGLAALVWSRRETGAGPAADADLVAVAPFDAADPGLQLWREGLVDILTRDLDGAGPLRTVPPSVALRRWEGRADRPSAEAFGARTGAGLVIYGNVVRRGADSVGIRATVLDRTSNSLDANLEVIGEERRIGELADSLGLRILRLLGQRRAIASSRHTSLGARSFPALKEFLHGEQFYRRGEVDSALVHYDRAISADSTFTLALRRMGWTLGSGAATSWRYASGESYIRRAVVLNRGLSPRDSILLWSDSIGQLARGAGTADLLVGNIYRAVASLEELARRYPDDPGIWYELGERYAHTPLPAGRDNRAALDAFDRAIALDSGFAPAYMHTVRHAFQVGDADLARRYARAYVAQGLPYAQTPNLHFVLQLLDSGGVGAPALRDPIRTAAASTLNWAAHEHFRWATDSAETAVVLFREVVTGGHDLQGAGAITTDTLMQRQQLARALAFRGHLREAAEVNAGLIRHPGASRLSYHSDPFPDLALFDVLDEGLVRRTFAQALSLDWTSGGSSTIPPRILTGLPWLSVQRDSTMLRRMVARGREMERSASGSLGKARGRYFGAAADAYLALVRGDSAAAVARFGAISDSLCIVGDCFAEKLTLARLLAARGDHAGAAALLARWENSGLPRPLHVLAALEHGRSAERLGDRTTAARKYRFVVEAWRQPDAQLLPLVEEAGAGLIRAEGVRSGD